MEILLVECFFIIIIIFLVLAQNIDCGYILGGSNASTHNLCFEAKIRKISISLQTPILKKQQQKDNYILLQREQKKQQQKDNYILLQREQNE